MCGDNLGSNNRENLRVRKAFMVEQITNPPVRYTGSKWRIAPWVIKHFPPHTCYVEPFCGGASVLFRKQASPIEVINDLNGDVVNFFRVLRDNLTDLIRVIELTPYSRAELEAAMTLTDDPLERARRFYIRARQMYTAGEAQSLRGWRFERSTIRGTRVIDEWNNTSHLSPCAKRLKAAQIECDTALNVIKRYDDTGTLFYCDPPYVFESRSGSREYKNEMSDDDHVALAGTLNQIKGMAIISGYDTPLYRELYAGWQMITTEAYTLKNLQRIECLWVSPSATKSHRQKRLFDLA